MVPGRAQDGDIIVVATVAAHPVAVAQAAVPVAVALAVPGAAV